MLTASSRDTLAVGLKRVADIFWSTSVVKKDTDDDIFLNALRTTKCSVKTTNICKWAAPLLLTTSPCITRSAGVTCCLVVMVQEASIRKPLNTSTFCQNYIQNFFYCYLLLQIWFVFYIILYDIHRFGIFTVETSLCMDKDRVCSHHIVLDLGHQSSQACICHTEVLLCYADNSATRHLHLSEWRTVIYWCSV